MEKNIKTEASVSAGNHRKFSDFGWFDRPDDDENWMLYYTSNRDSDLIHKANEIVINDAMRPFSVGDDPDVTFERHGHWAVGYVDGFSIRVYRDGKITEAFKKLHELRLGMDEYPILNESLYSDMEYEAQFECVKSELSYLVRSNEASIVDIDGCAHTILRWISENNDSAINSDYVEGEAIKEAAYELGYLKRDDD
jgi:hypothetical protein